MDTPTLIIILIILSSLVAVLGCAYFTIRDVMAIDWHPEDETDTRHYNKGEEDAHSTKPGSLG